MLTQPGEKYRPWPCWITKAIASRTVSFSCGRLCESRAKRAVAAVAEIQRHSENRMSLRQADQRFHEFRQHQRR